MTCPKNRLSINGQDAVRLFLIKAKQPMLRARTALKGYNMGEIIGAGLLAHAPTIMMSKEDRYALNEGKEISLVPGLHRVRDEIYKQRSKSVPLGRWI